MALVSFCGVEYITEKKISVKCTLTGSVLTLGYEKGVIGIQIFKISIQAAVLHKTLQIEYIMTKTVRSTSGDVINASCKACCCHDKIQMLGRIYLI